MVATDVRVRKARVVFRGPGPQVNGLQAVPEGLWVGDQLDNRVYLVDYDGKVLTSFASPVRNDSGVAFGAGSVWVGSNARPNSVYRHDPATGHCTAHLLLPNWERGGVHGVEWRPYAPGEAVPEAPPARAEAHPAAPGGKPNAGPGVSGTLWVTRPGAHVIDHVDAETADLLGQVTFAANRSHGLFWDEADGTLNVVETNFGHVYKLDPKTSAVLDEWRIEGAEVHAMTRSADGRIWIGDAASKMIAIVED
jgi:streptogramin lyase